MCLLAARGLSILASTFQYLSLQSNLKHEAKVRQPHLNPPGSYELVASHNGKSQASSYEPRGSHVVRELLRKPAMFQIGFIEFFRGRPRGGDNFTSLFKCSRPFIQSVKSTLSHLKSCNPVGGTPSSTA